MQVFVVLHLLPPHYPLPFNQSTSQRNVWQHALASANILPEDSVLQLFKRTNTQLQSFFHFCILKKLAKKA